MVVNGNTLEIYTGGKDISLDITEYFKSLSITDAKGKNSDSFMMTLADPLGKLTEPDTWKTLEFHINGINKGAFEVNELSGDIHTNEIEISGTAITTKGGLKVRKSRSFDAITIGDIVKQIAGEHDFDPVIDDVLSVVDLGHINQVKESDLNLLTRIASDHAAMFKAAHGKMVFINRDTATNKDGEDLPVMEISDPRKTSGRWSRKRRDKVGSVKAEWFNEDTNKVEYEYHGEDEPVQELNDRYKSKELAKSAALSEFNRLNKMDRSLNISIPLDVKYIAGCNANISNHGLINGVWGIESMTHSMSVTGYDLTSIELVRPD